MSTQLYRLGLPLAAGLALAIRLSAAAGLHFDGLYGQDSFAYFYHGFALWRNHALEYHWPWLPTPTRLFWPMGYPSLLALVFSIAGRASATASQIVTLASGLVVTALTYGLALRFARSILPSPASHAAAFCAAALIACSGLQVQASITIMSDAPALAWALFALWLWTGPTRGRKRRRIVSFLAGASLAAAISTRYEYAPLIVAPVVYWLMTASPSEVNSQSSESAPSLRYGLVGALLAGLPQFVYSISYSAPILHNAWLTEWNLSHLWQANFNTPDGTQHYSHTVGAFYLIRPLVAPESLPWILAPFLPFGLLALAWKGGRRPYLPAWRWSPGATGPAPGHDPGPSPSEARPLISAQRDGVDPASNDTGIVGSRGGRCLALLLAWWLIPTLYLVGVPFESARFALIAQPALAIGEGIGLVWVARLLRIGRQGYGRLITATAVIWAGCGLALVGTESRSSVAVLAQGKTSDQAAIAWIRAHASPGSTVVTFDLTLMLYHYGSLDSQKIKLYDLSALDEADWPALARAPHVLAVVNVGNLARQWRGLPPDRNFLRLKTQRRLAPVAVAGAYTIYE